MSNESSNNGSEIDLKNIQVLADAVSKAIKENKGDMRFIDLARIPLICLSMANMSKALDDIKNMMIANRKESDEQHETFLTKESFNLQFEPIKTVVYGGVGVALLALTGAVISLVIK